MKYLWLKKIKFYNKTIRLPSEFLLDYFEKDNVTSVKNGRYNIRIQIDGTKFILGESGRKKHDLSDFFISNSDKC